MRALLCLLLCLLVLVLGLATAVVQCRNHARARSLAEMQRRLEMVEAAVVQMKARASAHIPGEQVFETGESAFAPQEGMQ